MFMSSEQEGRRKTVHRKPKFTWKTMEIRLGNSDWRSEPEIRTGNPDRKSEPGTRTGNPNREPGPGVRNRESEPGIRNRESETRNAKPGMRNRECETGNAKPGMPNCFFFKRFKRTFSIPLLFSLLSRRPPLICLQLPLPLLIFSSSSLLYSLSLEFSTSSPVLPPHKACPNLSNPILAPRTAGRP